MSKFAVREGLELENGTYLIDFTVDPTAAAGIAAPIGSLGLRTNGETWHKTGAGNTAWVMILDAAGASPEDVFQNTYVGKPAAGSLLPQYTSVTQIALNDALLVAASKLDGKIGANLTPVTRTYSPVVGADTIHVNMSKLDAAVGTDAQVVSTVHISVNSSAFTKASVLDAALNTHELNTSNSHAVTLNQAIASSGVTNGSVTVQTGATWLFQTGSVLAVTDDPSNPTDVANKNYVDAVANGLSPKQAVRLATATAITDAYTYDNGVAGVGGTLTKTTNGAFPDVDSVTSIVGDRIILKDETGGNAPYNGIYVLTTLGDGSNPWQLTRATDNDEATEIPGATTFVMEGTVNEDRKYVCTTDAPVVVGTTDISWTIYSALEHIVAGAGLDKAADTLYITDLDRGVQVNPSGLEVAAAEVASNGLAAGGSAWQLVVQAGDDGSANLANVISVQSNGISVKLDEVTLEENASNQLAVADKHISSGTTGATPTALSVDAVPIASIVSCEWIITVSSVATPTKIYQVKVLSICDTTGTIDRSRYGVNVVGSAISGLDIDVGYSAPNMELQITATESVKWRVIRNQQAR